tara:strand:+ start:37 stop:876 length:840 start_codon:yes stop_codon:yes gene_type:complete
MYYEKNTGNLCDANHGTHVASVCSGNTHKKYTGVAPESMVFDLCIQSNISKDALYFIEDSLAWVAACGKDNDVAIVNMSFGSDSPIGNLKMVTEDIIKQGIFIVAATGNSQHVEKNDLAHVIKYPAAYPDVFSIGSVGVMSGKTLDYTKTSTYSETGDNIDFTAPGKNIIGALSKSVKDTLILSGTSQACPYASGVIALLMSFIQQNDIVIEEPKTKRLNYLLSKLVKKADSTYDDSGHNEVYGFGIIDLNFPSTKLKDIKTFILKTLKETPDNHKMEY